MLNYNQLEHISQKLTKITSSNIYITASKNVYIIYSDAGYIKIKESDLGPARITSIIEYIKYNHPELFL